MGETEVKIKRIKMPSATVTSVLWIIIGTILLIYPGQSLDMICRIVGILVLVAGIIQIVMGTKGAGMIPGQATLATGAVIAIVGLFFVIRPDILVSILPFIAGVMLIIRGVTSLVNSFQLAGAKYGYWWVGILISVIGIGLGVILFFNAHSTAAFIARIIGVFLLYSGISSLWISSRKAKVLKDKKLEDEVLDVDATITDVEE